MTARKRTYFARRQAMLAAKAIYDDYAALDAAVKLLIQKLDLKLVKSVTDTRRDLCQTWRCYHGQILQNSPCSKDCPYKITAIALTNGKWFVAEFNRHHSWELPQVPEQESESSDPENPPNTIQGGSAAGLSPPNSPTIELETLFMAEASLEPPADAPGHVVTDSIGSQTVDSEPEGDRNAEPAPSMTSEFVPSSDDEMTPQRDAITALRGQDYLDSPGESKTDSEAPSPVDELIALATQYARSAISPCSAPDSQPYFALEKDDPLHIFSKPAISSSTKEPLGDARPHFVETCGAATNGLSTFQADAAYTRYLQQDIIAMPIHMSLSSHGFQTVSQTDKPINLDECSTPSESPVQKEVLTLSAISDMPSPPPTPASFPDIDIEAERDSFNFSDYLILSPEAKASPLQTFPDFDSGEPMGVSNGMDVMEEISKLLQRHPSTSKQGSPIVDRGLLIVDKACKADRISDVSSDLTSIEGLDGSSLTAISASTDVPVPPPNEHDKREAQAERNAAQRCNMCHMQQRAADMVRCTGKHDKSRWVHTKCMSSAERSVLMFRTKDEWLCRRCDSYDAEDPDSAAGLVRVEEAERSSATAQELYVQPVTLNAQITPVVSESAEMREAGEPSGMIFEGCYIPPEEPVRRISQRLSKRLRPTKVEDIVEPPKKKVARVSAPIKPMPKPQSGQSIPKSSAKVRTNYKSVEKEDTELEPITVATTLPGFSKKRAKAGAENLKEDTAFDKTSPEPMKREFTPYTQYTIRREMPPVSDLPPTPSTSGARSLSPVPSSSQPPRRFDVQDYAEHIQGALKSVGVVDDVAFQALQLVEDDITAFINYLENVEEDQEEVSDDHTSDMDEEQEEEEDEANQDNEDEAMGGEDEEEEAEDDEEEEEQEDDDDDDDASLTIIELWRARHLMACSIAESQTELSRRLDLGGELYSLLPGASVVTLKHLGIDNRDDLLGRLSRETTEAFFTAASGLVDKMGDINAAERWLTLRRICQMHDWEYMEGTDGSTPLSDIWTIKAELSDLGEASHLGDISSGHHMQRYECQTNVGHLLKLREFRGSCSISSCSCQPARQRL